MELRGTTILAVRHKGHVALIGDGQVTMGQSIVMKHTAKKVRRMYKDQILAGFAGATADAFTLFERFDAHLEQTGGNLLRAAVELAKDWRSDKFLRKLEAMLLVADKDHTLVLTGTGDVIEPDDGIASIGSGGPYALSAARALVRHSDLDADAIALESMKIAADICVFTNTNFTRYRLSPPSGADASGRSAPFSSAPRLRTLSISSSAHARRIVPERRPVAAPRPPRRKRPLTAGPFSL